MNCKSCRKEYIPTTRFGKKPSYCSPLCRNRRGHSPQLKRCFECSVEYQTMRKRQKYCSEVCAKKAFVNTGYFKRYYTQNREKKLQYTRDYTAHNREKIEERSQKYRDAHRKEKADYDKQYRAKNYEKRIKQMRDHRTKFREIYLQRAAEGRKRRREKIRRYERDLNAVAVKHLLDPYIKQILCKTGLPYSQIPQSLIELKREALKYKRLLRKYKEVKENEKARTARIAS